MTEPPRDREETCKRCRVSLPPNYAARKCAFATGVFSDANWNCGTANALRDIASIHKAATRWNDQSIAYVPMPEYGFIVLGWYKQRGALDTAVMLDNFAPITLAEAEEAIAAFSADLEGAEANWDYEPKYRYGGNDDR